MKKPDIKTASQVVPVIYAYTHPDYPKHSGCTKIGQSEQTAGKRIGQQNDTADVSTKLEWVENAVFSGTNDVFTDHMFHAYLSKKGIERLSRQDGNGKTKLTEWFRVLPRDARLHLMDFRDNRGIVEISGTVPYTLRDEQDEAVTMTVEYKNNHENGEFLWNAKPRFGKTLSVYDFIKRIDAGKVLVVTNRPAVANSWLEDYKNFLGTESGYYFVSEAETVKGKPSVLSRKEFVESIVLNEESEEKKKCIEFVSLQDLKGSVYFGGKFDKLVEIAEMVWDVLVIDEAHEGVDTYKTDVAFNHIKRSFTLHLSGTPFKAIANDKFNSDAIYNWTYADEQKKKHEWSNVDENNPYRNLPQLNLYTYQMSEIVRDELSQGVEINGETEEYAFDLNEFFKTNEAGRFVYNSSVDKFLDAMVTQEKFPFSTQELRDELNHTFWLLDRVDSVKALAKKLKEHPVFKDYCIVLAAGDGKLNDEEETQKSYDKVVDAISKYDKTITLSVGQLTTGITIPEWTAVLMLSNMKSPSLYMQAAFRAQNPCLFKNGTEFKRKENAYVFDFDPARTLTIFEEFANDLYSSTSSGRGDIGQRKKNIRELLNFFPVIGEDEEGELIELDAEKVLSIPRKIRSAEVVRRGFMSNFLFQNISNIFGAPKVVTDILEKFEPAEEPDLRGKMTDEVKENLHLNDDGEVELSEEYVIGQETAVFGNKVYGPAVDIIETAVEKINTEKQSEKQILKDLKDMFGKEVMDIVVDTAKDYYGTDMKKSDQNRIQSTIKQDSNRIIESLVGDFTIDKNVTEQQKLDAMASRFETGRSTDEIEAEFEQKLKDKEKTFKEKVNAALDNLVRDSTKKAVRTVETNKIEREKKTIEEGIRDHLRGFTRTIPSFLMAYGDDTVTLATFDDIIPDNVFKEVTSITLDEFRFLRDGGMYTDEETGEKKQFEGRLFDSVVFDDSVKEFLALKKKLANYFDEQSIEDIFDYIPPQKTNQIFTPKDMVKKMVDLLEKENPGCFDMPDKTFIDLYMKSGLYITEIVKRLYNSNRIKQLYPDNTDRLKHIFEKQVYGLAPTEIIYKIATSFILGFDEDVKITKHNFKQLDALPYAKEGTLEEKLDEIYGETTIEENVTTSSEKLDMQSIAIGTRVIDNTYGHGKIVNVSTSDVTIKFDENGDERKFSKWQLSNSSMIIE